MWLWDVITSKCTSACSFPYCSRASDYPSACHCRLPTPAVEYLFYDSSIPCILFVCFVHKKYSLSFINLRLNPWYHMDYFNEVLTTFLGLDRGSYIAVYAGSESSRIPSKIYLFVLCRQTKVLWVGTTWGWIINDRIFIFGRTIPLRKRFKLNQFRSRVYFHFSSHNFHVFCER